VGIEDGHLLGTKESVANCDIKKEFNTVESRMNELLRRIEGSAGFRVIKAFIFMMMIGIRYEKNVFRRRRSS
jgi:hypothetical protein